MFRREMLRNLEAIFGMKATFNAPSDAYEQDTIFVEIQNSNSRVNYGKEYATVRGMLILFCQDSKVPYGFFNKKLHSANPDYTKNFTFRDFDQDIGSSGARLMNLRERRVNFTYLYSGQHDPGGADMEGIEFIETKDLADGEGNVIETGDGPLEALP